MNDETYELQMGKCPKCGASYGYICLKGSGKTVNQYSRCMCERSHIALDDDVTREHNASFNPNRKDDVA